MIIIYADILTFADSILHKPFMAWYTLCFTLNVKWFSIISITHWILASCQFPISLNYLVINQTLWGYCSIYLITTGIHKIMSAAWKTSFIFFFFFWLTFQTCTSLFWYNSLCLGTQTKQPQKNCLLLQKPTLILQHTHFFEKHLFYTLFAVSKKKKR